MLFWRQKPLRKCERRKGKRLKAKIKTERMPRTILPTCLFVAVSWVSPRYTRGIKMKTIIPNLFIDNCKENLEYYRQIFGGELKNVVPRFDEAEIVMHAELHINKNCVLYFGEKLEEAPPNSNFHIFLKLDAKDDIQNIYNALRKDGDVEIELSKSFWGTLHGVVVDRNGTTWDLDK
jgi:PhnB protein